MGSHNLERVITVQNNVLSIDPKYDLIQQELAVEVGVSRQTIPSLEIGSHNIDLKIMIRELNILRCILNICLTLNIKVVY